MAISPSTTEPTPPRKLRVLFGAVGWPSGVLEVGSWAKRTGLADVVIFQVNPGYAFPMDADDARLLSAGPVDAEIVDAFARGGRALSPDATVRRADSGAWEIDDRRRGWTYCLKPARPDGEGFDVTVRESCDARPLAAVAERARDTALLFQADGSPTPALENALHSLGGPFLAQLVEFRPHVVGFRLEGGGLEPVKGFIRGVRLVSNAEIVLGGPTATSHPAEVLEDTGADYVFAGEAEETFARFLRLAWQRNSVDRQPEVPGLAYRYGGRVLQNTLPADGYGRTVLDVDRGICGQVLRCMRNLVRPVAGADVIAANRLDWLLLDGFRQEVDSLFFTGGRGCPGACTFCAKLHGQEVRVKPARQLLEEIEAADARVREGALRVGRWPLFRFTDDPALRDREVGWAAVYDEDFFLHRRRAIAFFRLWAESPLHRRYRISVQTNPCSMLTAAGQPHEELFRWIDRLKPMVQLGAESFNPEVLARWRKRHNVGQLAAVLDALDATGQDYTVFQLLTDFDTTAEELIDSLRLLILAAFARPRMRIASSPFTIPLYESDTRRLLEFRGDPGPGRIGHFTDYEEPQPGWMDPLVAELADAADAELQFTLQPTHRDAALVAAMEQTVGRIRRQQSHATGRTRPRLAALREQAEWSLDQVQEARFQAVRR